MAARVGEDHTISLIYGGIVRNWRTGHSSTLAFSMRNSATWYLFDALADSRPGITMQQSFRVLPISNIELASSTEISLLAFGLILAILLLCILGELIFGNLSKDWQTYVKAGLISVGLCFGLYVLIEIFIVLD